MNVPDQAPEKKNFYFKDAFTDLLFLVTLSKHAFKGAEIAECYSAAALVEEADPASWGAAWNTLAARTEATARSAEAQGHRVSARESYLRAVTYYRNVLWSVPASDPAYRAMLATSRTIFQRFAALSDPPIEVIDIPYEGTTLPGYFLRPDASGQPRPTVALATLPRR
jgi:hypothetical protein